MACVSTSMFMARDVTQTIARTEIYGNQKSLRVPGRRELNYGCKGHASCPKQKRKLRATRTHSKSCALEVTQGIKIALRDEGHVTPAGSP
jgi:hypothetical protein